MNAIVVPFPRRLVLKNFIEYLRSRSIYTMPTKYGRRKTGPSWDTRCLSSENDSFGPKKLIISNIRTVISGKTVMILIFLSFFGRTRSSKTYAISGKSTCSREARRYMNAIAGE